MRELLRCILEAFPAANPPGEDAVVADFVPESRPLEAEELRRELAGKSWTELSHEFIDTHADWLVYLSDQAFAYFLPAWLVRSLNYHEAGYAADWIVSFFAHPPASEPISHVQWRMLNALDSVQKSAVIEWLEYMIRTFPDADPGRLKQQGLTLEDAVYNLSLRPYDDEQ